MQASRPSWFLPSLSSLPSSGTSREPLRGSPGETGAETAEAPVQGGGGGGVKVAITTNVLTAYDALGFSARRWERSSATSTRHWIGMASPMGARILMNPMGDRDSGKFMGQSYIYLMATAMLLKHA